MPHGCSNPGPIPGPISNSYINIVVIMSVGNEAGLGRSPIYVLRVESELRDSLPNGVSQQVVLINGQFLGPRLKCTTNNNIMMNMFNNLDEPFLLH
ncbi:hypothetical protein ACSBR2_007868 [Camellia fascicularis]